MARSNSLRGRILFSIVGLLAGGFSFALAGTLLYLSIGEDRFYTDLSEAAREAVEQDWLEDGPPAPGVLEEIALAHEKHIYPAYENSYLVFALLSVLVIIVGSGLAWNLSRRLTLPLEKASQSAKLIANGDFSHRMEIPDGASEEIVSLSESFIYLSDSLQKMEDNVRYTSASVAHELRTPLTVIQGYVQGIQDGVFQANTEQLDLILGHVAGLSRLVDDLKLISLAESKGLVLHRTQTDLEACAVDAVNFMRPQFDQAGGALAIAPARRAINVCVDAERVKQALVALISNALRYAGPDARCTVACAHDNGTVSIKVADAGAGFSDEALDRASDRFWRGDPSRDRAQGGSGLGLAVVRAIAEAHGGALELSNAPTGGAVAAITFPSDDA
ncbi:MAG: ATP-binding protein [Pseudomonadota bacterium]